MDKLFKVGIPILILVVLVLVGATIGIKANQKRIVAKMYNDVEQALLALIPEGSEALYRLEKVFNKTYDYLLETPTTNYFIRVVPNLKNEEICVNNAMKWQLRKSFNDESMRFVEGIEGLMRMDVDHAEKHSKKLYVVYPNARTLLKYINECEMIFIDYDTDVYGTNIVPYIFLRDNKDKFKI